MVVKTMKNTMSEGNVIGIGQVAVDAQAVGGTSTGEARYDVAEIENSSAW